LYIFDNSNEHKNTIIELHLNNGQGLALTDRQKAANIKLNPENKSGVDALSDDLSEVYLAKQLQRRKKIKAVLTDQNIIRGIGNAYVDEILWEARISPFSISKAIPPYKVNELAKAIKKVLQHAIEQIQKTHPGIITGEVRDFLVIHNSRLKKSPTGSAIKVEKKGGSTYYTDEQELFE
jgi:formamidopyrimidine-DNA glycosylase